jgi:hypothetical protein
MIFIERVGELSIGSIKLNIYGDGSDHCKIDVTDAPFSLSFGGHKPTKIRMINSSSSVMNAGGPGSGITISSAGGTISGTVVTLPFSGNLPNNEHLDNVEIAFQYPTAD